MEFGHIVEGLMKDEILFFSHFDILKCGTSFENQPKCRISNFLFLTLHCPLIFVLLKLTCLVILFDRTIQVIKNSPNRPFWTKFQM